MAFSLLISNYNFSFGLIKTLKLTLNLCRLEVYYYTLWSARENGSVYEFHPLQKDTQTWIELCEGQYRIWIRLTKMKKKGKITTIGYLKQSEEGPDDHYKVEFRDNPAKIHFSNKNTLRCLKTALSSKLGTREGGNSSSNRAS